MSDSANISTWGVDMKQLEEFKQFILKSIREFANSLPVEFYDAVDKKDHIELRSYGRGALFMLPTTQYAFPPFIILNDVGLLLISLGFHNTGTYGEYSVFRKAMRSWDGDEFIDWLFNSGIKISENVINTVSKYRNSIESAQWIKEVLIGTNDIIYSDIVILRRRRENPLTKLTKLLKPTR